MQKRKNVQKFATTWFFVVFIQEIVLAQLYYADKYKKITKKNSENKINLTCEQLNSIAAQLPRKADHANKS